MDLNVYEHILNQKKNGKKGFALLVDPDKYDSKKLEQLIKAALNAHVDYFLVGGSLLSEDNFQKTIAQLKIQTQIPVVIFPGSTIQIDKNADALMFLSLISGRNPELLIGKQVESSLLIHKAQLESISTGYMLIESGKMTSVNYMSHTMPIPADKDEIAVATALAGQLLGMQMIYLEAGSGALNPVSSSMIKAVSNILSVPLIVGGGIKTPEKAIANISAGADIIVIGNAIEKDPSIIVDMSAAIHSVNTKVH